MRLYDLVISLGERCSTSMLLRSLNFQTYSFPFDWLLSYSNNFVLKSNIELISNDFNNFLDIESLEDVPESPLRHHKKVCNKKINYYFLHDFPIDKSIEESFKEIDNKYKRRINRMYDMINLSESILFLYINTREKLSIQSLNNCLKMLQDKFFIQNSSFSSPPPRKKLTYFIFNTMKQWTPISAK